MTRLRRRVTLTASKALAWDRERDFEVARQIASGRGIRPHDWWVFDSKRPDLAAPAGDDAYAHLRGEGPFMDRARERLRYLATTGELRDSELAAIASGSGGRYLWRQRVLAKVGPE